jgi:hypothetical protein
LRARRALAIVAAVLGSLIIAGGIAAVVTGGRHAAASGNSSSVTTTSVSPTTTAAAAADGWHPVPPATTVPQSTPVQSQYDKGFEKGFSSPSNEAMMARAESLSIPAPAVGEGWASLPVANTPESWSTEFVSGLLDINFASQSRSALGSWLVAQEAPDLMPGIPTAFQDLSLYTTVLAPQITGQPSPIPTTSEWNTLAASGTRWSVSDLETQLAPQWQQMITAGWQPEDLRADVEDVSGVLTITQGKSTSTKQFSLVLQLGSAHWHDGYGTVLVSNFKES